MVYTGIQVAYMQMLIFALKYKRLCSVEIQASARRLVAYYTSTIRRNI